LYFEPLAVPAGLWVAQGPSPAIGGQSEGITNNPVAGAVRAVLPNPTNANILYAGSVNGGIWKTTNATSSSPTWTNLTDFLPSQSIGELVFDPTDGTNQTILAGVGRFSSLASDGGRDTGVLKTSDGGTNWVRLGETTFS